MKIDWNDKNKLIAKIQARGEIIRELIQWQLEDRRRLKAMERVSVDLEFEVYE